MLCREYIIGRDGSGESPLSNFSLLILWTHKDQMMPIKFDETLMTVTLLAILSLNLLRVVKKLSLNLSEGIAGHWWENRERRDCVWLNG